jgi:hypothetical protein
LEVKKMGAHQSENAGGFLIESTGQGKSAQFSDISMTGLFNAHVATINSERQAIWQRYNIMVFANSIIFSLSLSEITEYGAETITGAAVGLVLCLIWWRTFKSGLELYELWTDNAAKFVWQGLNENANPYAISRKWRNASKGFERSSGGPVYFGGLFTIFIFALGYVALLAMEGYDQWRSLQTHAIQSSFVKPADAERPYRDKRKAGRFTIEDFQLVKGDKPSGEDDWGRRRAVARADVRRPARLLQPAPQRRTPYKAIELPGRA